MFLFRQCHDRDGEGDTVDVVIRRERSGSADFEDPIRIILGSEKGENIPALLLLATERGFGFRCEDQ